MVSRVKPCETSGGFNLITNGLNNLADQGFILAFAHYADQWLSS